MEKPTKNWKKENGEIFEYGAKNYSSVGNSSLKILLDPIHNTYFRLAIGAFKSSLIANILHIIANELSLWIRRIHIALTFAAKKKKKWERIMHH